MELGSKSRVRYGVGPLALIPFPCAIEKALWMSGTHGSRAVPPAAKSLEQPCLAAVLLVDSNVAPESGTKTSLSSVYCLSPADEEADHETQLYFSSRHAVLGLITEPALAQAATSNLGDGRADGKQSLGGSGEMIEFTLPGEKAKSTRIAGLRIHGSRSGTPQAPNESFLIFFLDQEGKRILHTEMAPYSLFERGAEKWVTVSFDRPIDLPRKFWVALDFRATQRKGVYVSYDTSTGGKHSRKRSGFDEATHLLAQRERGWPLPPAPSASVVSRRGVSLGPRFRTVAARRVRPRSSGDR
jgi:hypothetical protein